jgi:hypothetical protein
MEVKNSLVIVAQASCLCPLAGRCLRHKCHLPNLIFNSHKLTETSAKSDFQPVLMGFNSKPEF